MKQVGKISNSENGMVYFKQGLSSCICSGGTGHDSTYPKIIEYYEAYHEIDRHHRLSAARD